MASQDVSSDEGEILEATPQPRSEQNGDVDRAGRNRGRFSRSPETESFSRRAGDGSYRPSQSPPRGQKRGRDDRDRREPRQFHVHYEDASRHDRDRDRDLDRPSSRHSNGPDHPQFARSGPRYGNRDALPSRPGAPPRHRDFDHSRDGYPDKRHRSHRSRSPPSHRDRGRRDRGRPGRDSQDYERYKYSAQNERDAHGSSVSKRADPAEALGNRRQDAKRDQGVTDNRGTDKAKDARFTANNRQNQSRQGEPDGDWEPDATVDKEAAIEAEIQRRKRAREEAYKRAVGGLTPTIQHLQGGAKASSTPGSTRYSTPIPGVQKTEASTPRSDIFSPGGSPPAGISAAASPAPFDFADDSNLMNIHAETKADEDDNGPSAADYDPTVDMQEDERRQEMHVAGVAPPGEDRRASLADAAPEPEALPPQKNKDDDDDGFDMFADNFDEENFAAPAAKPTQATQDSALGPAAGGGGGGILEGDDKDGYYKIRPGEMLDGRYQISSALGRGMFSGVARAIDTKTQTTVAIKIMRNNDALRKGGFTEIAILQKLNSADPENKKHVVQFERSFEYKGHLCMAFENLSLNLREVLKKFGNNVGINLNATRAYAYQIFLSLGHMRKCSIIHADLKPDNILVNEARNVLKICDLGTAIDRSDAATASNEITPYLVSRFYRAPEIILGMPYDYAIDMWSIGCTLYELYTGKILFTGDSNNQMLKNIMEIRGKFTPKLYRRGHLSNMHFDEMGNFVSVETDKMLGKTNVRTLPVVKATRDLRTRLLAASSGMNDAETRELNHFVDLLERCLTLNPDKRITPTEALRHPFFTHRAHATGR